MYFGCLKYVFNIRFRTNAVSVDRDNMFLRLWNSVSNMWCHLNFSLTKSHEQVVLSQWNGSNRGGFNVVPSNSKRPINLDGIFNIISYDVVPKLQDKLLASAFKVIIWYPVLFVLHRHTFILCNLRFQALLISTFLWYNLI